MASGDSEVKTLLNFVSLASSDIKAALDRSAPCRRSVDHRKYLQKQLRRFSHRCPALRGTHTARHTASVATAVAGRHEREGASSEDGARPGHLPMRKRQLPASFWKEPQSPSAGLEQLLKGSASGTVHGDRRKAVFDEFRASPLLSGSAEPPPPRRSVACVCPCACCPLQYGRFLLQHGHAHTDAPFRSKTSESSVDISHSLLDGLHSSGTHVVIKPIPTKPVSSSIFSVFGFI